MKLLARKIVICLLAAVLSFSPGMPYAQSSLLPAPGTLVTRSDPFFPVIIKGLTFHPSDPLLFDFIVDTGNSGYKADGSDARLEMESKKLIKYFLASMTIPDQEQWVNLSPYEKDRIIPQELGKTELGRDLLVQDYMLKQITASLIYPEKELGRIFWARVYERAQREFGVTDVPLDVFNKVWVVADQASVYKKGSTIFVANSHLKVMLESDYMAALNSSGSSAFSSSREMAKQIIREIVLPELEKEVNMGRNFAGLRQIFHSMILAVWYKKNLKEAFLTQVYANRKKTDGVEGLWVGSKGTDIDPDQIYDQYVAAFKAGVFNYIKDDENSAGDIIARKYFSGGIQAPQVDSEPSFQAVTSAHGALARVRVNMLRNKEEGLKKQRGYLSYEELEVRKEYFQDRIRFFDLQVKKLYDTWKFEESRSKVTKANINLRKMRQSLRSVEIRMRRAVKNPGKSNDVDQAMDALVRTGRVLVVDDSLPIRQILEIMLESEGYRVVLAEDGQDAVEKVQERLKMGEKFNLMLTDTDMPRKGGLELVQELSEIDPGLPVIGMSGDEDRFLPGTIKTFISKPFDYYELLSYIDQFSRVDEAMLVKGGIELNTSRLVLSESGVGVPFVLDPALMESFRQVDFVGITPVILSVTPIPNFSLLMAADPV